MKQRVFKTFAGIACFATALSAYTCVTFALINCAQKGDTASLVVTCQNSALTWTQTQTASAMDSWQVRDYAVTPPHGAGYWSDATTVYCPVEWEYVSCNGQEAGAYNLTIYPTPTGAQNCNQP